MRVMSLFAVGLFLLAGQAAAQSWTPPADNQRCPSKWGAGDERGSGNHMKPETVLRAARLIKTGEVFELGRVLAEGMPLPAGRRFETLTKRIHLLENLRLDEVAARRAHEFALIVEPLKNSRRHWIERGADRHQVT